LESDSKFSSQADVVDFLNDAKDTVYVPPKIIVNIDGTWYKFWLNQSNAFDTKCVTELYNVPQSDIDRLRRVSVNP